MYLLSTSMSHNGSSNLKEEIAGDWRLGRWGPGGSEGLYGKYWLDHTLTTRYRWLAKDQPLCNPLKVPRCLCRGRSLATRYRLYLKDNPVFQARK